MKYEERNQRNRQIKIQNRIIGIAVLSLLLAACGAPSGVVNGNSGIRNSSDMEMPPEEGDIEEQPKEWGTVGA